MTKSGHGSAVLTALLVTFLWSTSWVLIKIGLTEIPAITFAGLRYALAFLFLCPGLWRRREEIRHLNTRNWALLLALGVVFYALTQGGQFLTLAHMDAVPFSLLLSFSPILVAGIGAVVLHERTTLLQALGIALALAGALLYFAPLSVPRGSAVGFLLAGGTVIANAVAAVLGRAANRRRIASPVVITGLSMGVGAAILLGSGWATQGLPSLTLRGWGIVVSLAVVNTALAFTLWNRALRTLSATESSVVNNTMLIQIAILAVLLLGESLSGCDIVGLLVVAIGTALVQLRRIRRRDAAETNNEKNPTTSEEGETPE